MVIRVLPCPRGLSRERLEKLMCAGNRKIDSYPIETQELVDSEYYDASVLNDLNCTVFVHHMQYVHVHFCVLCTLYM